MRSRAANPPRQYASSAVADGSPTSLVGRLAALGIPLATLDTVPLLDVAIDGSDEARCWPLSREARFAWADNRSPRPG